ncbi:hypothetical protein [Bradyrhizobium sp. SZCCHNS3051]|uniref:hypothetical protein n=1 Tax=Bradyrhizobium sp. SZCCHNS3051 TaxID=3057320 RepID=UPI00291610E2|nr:hypothetical protein [Bradyrhizobium sp. SZCCHNS3051]
MGLIIICAEDAVPLANVVLQQIGGSADYIMWNEVDGQTQVNGELYFVGHANIAQIGDISADDLVKGFRADLIKACSAVYLVGCGTADSDQQLTEKTFVKEKQIRTESVFYPELPMVSRIKAVQGCENKPIYGTGGTLITRSDGSWRIDGRPAVAGNIIFKQVNP